VGLGAVALGTTATTPPGAPRSPGHCSSKSGEADHRQVRQQLLYLLDHMINCNTAADVGLCCAGGGRGGRGGGRGGRGGRGGGSSGGTPVFSHRPAKRKEQRKAARQEKKHHRFEVQQQHAQQRHASSQQQQQQAAGTKRRAGVSGWLFEGCHGAAWSIARC
jgi:hypothetical protein